MYNLYVYSAYKFVKLEILGFCIKVEEEEEEEGDGEGGLLESEVYNINAGLLIQPLSCRACSEVSFFFNLLIIIFYFNSSLRV